MLDPTDDTPYFALIDDDSHSAHLLTRALVAQGAPAIRHLGGSEDGEAALAAILGDISWEWPDLVIIDLKTHTSANIEFLNANHAFLRQKGIPIAVMTAPTDRSGRDNLHRAGASAVFFRQADRDAYRREAAAIISFWARHQRLDAVGM